MHFKLPSSVDIQYVEDVMKFQAEKFTLHCTKSELTYKPGENALRYEQTKAHN